MNSYNYLFNNLTRWGNDVTAISAREVQNNEIGTYNTTNYFLEYCGMEKPMKLATSQQGIVINSGPGVCGAGGCNIDSDSNIKIATIQTNPKCRINLHQRQFLTVPYLGRGPCYPTLENNLRMGKTIKISKEKKNLTEKEFPVKIPLIPQLEKNIQNTKHIIETDVNNNWVRGGLPSRRYQKEKKC